MLTVDPLEGAESNNVDGSCFAWQSVKCLVSVSTHTMERRSRGALADDSPEVSLIYWN